MKRGDVYRVAMPRTRGHVQHGSRYAVVVQSDEFVPLSTTIIAPTSRTAPARTYRPAVTVGGEQTRVLVEQTRVIHVAALKERVGELALSEQVAVDEALRLVLGLT